MKFKREDGKFDIERFKAAVRIFITAQEILVDNASYPTKDIAENSHIFRTLGLGFANLGSLCMSYGLPYDSDEGRALAGAITVHHDRPRLRAKRGNRRQHRRVPGLSRRALRRRGRNRGQGQRGFHARASSTCTAMPSKTFIPARNLAISRTRPANAGTALWRAGSRRAIATPRSPCSRPPAPSPSSWIATPPAWNPTSRW